MKTAHPFFRRYVYTTMGILTVFFVVNVLFVAAYFLIASLNGIADSNFPMEEFSQHITLHNHALSADAKAKDLLRQFDAWAMILNEKGTVIWEERLPDALPHHYTATDIAMFSRWYLRNYPVNIWNHPAGLLVIGFPPGDFFKHNMSFRAAYIWPLLIGLGIALLINILLLLCLFLRNIHRLEKSVSPILDGIHALSQGEAFHLEEKGELAEINAVLNHAGEALRKKDDIRANWSRGISHDVRTPLSVILGYASDMEDHVGLPLSARTQAAVIRRQGEKLRTLIADLNLSTSLEYGTLLPRKEKIDPMELERQVVSEFLNHGLPETFAIRLPDDVLDTPVSLYGDGSLLYRMLYNLILNSIVHNPEGCVIEVSVQVVQNYYVFSIVDTGSGMDQQQMEMLNAEETPAPLPSEDLQEEHGLGLKIVRQIVKAHQGKIVFSQNVPSGLCVRVEILAGSKNRLL